MNEIEVLKRFMTYLKFYGNFCKFSPGEQEIATQLFSLAEEEDYWGIKALIDPNDIHQTAEKMMEVHFKVNYDISIDLIYADHDKNKFLPCAKVMCKDLEQQQKLFEEVVKADKSELKEEGAFVLDMTRDGSCEDSIYITDSIAEQLFGEVPEELIERGQWNLDNPLGFEITSERAQEILDKMRATE